MESQEPPDKEKQESQEPPKKEQKRNSWEEDENMTLKQVIKEQCGDRTTNIPWDTIIPVFNTRMKEMKPDYKLRIKRNIKDHYRWHLDPNIKNENFTQEECERILDLAKQYDKKWSIIQTYFQSHSQSQIRNTYISLIKKQNKTLAPNKSENTSQNDEKLPEVKEQSLVDSNETPESQEQSLVDFCFPNCEDFNWEQDLFLS